jgi:hypothetical protein
MKRPVRASALVCIGACLPILGGLACQQPVAREEGPVEIRLYDLSGEKRLLCDLAPSLKAPHQGFIRSKAAGGEHFQGEWIRLSPAREPDKAESKYPSSLPSLAAVTDPMQASWSWAAEFGISFNDFPRTYFSFMLYGDAGTLITGFFLDNMTAGRMAGFLRGGNPGIGLLGAARDNRGHRYKLMG